MRKIALFIIYLFTIPAILSAQSTSGNVETDSQPQSGLVSFTSNVNGRNIQLNWVTSSEQDISGFEVERTKICNQKSEFRNVGIASETEKINTQVVYSFEDKNLQSGSYQYRLKQTDNNGKVEYHYLSENIEVGLPANFEICQESPNLLNQTIKVNYTLPKESKVTIQIFDTENNSVITLINDVRTAGYHTFQFFIPEILNSTYYYGFKAETNGSKTIVLSRRYNSNKLLSTK